MSFIDRTYTRAFCDTNILIYAFDKIEHEKQSIAAKLLKDLMNRSSLSISTQVLQEFFVTVTRKIKQPLSVVNAISVMDDLSQWYVFTVDKSAIRKAALLSEDVCLSFWNALIVVSASRSGSKILFSEDMNHGQKILDIEIVNPFLP